MWRVFFRFELPHYVTITFYGPNQCWNYVDTVVQPVAQVQANKLFNTLVVSTL